MCYVTTPANLKCDLKKIYLFLYVAQLVKPIKGSVMPVKKKRKLPDADDNERKCKITR